MRLLLLTTFLLAACVSGPKPEKETGVADSLNGNNYEGTTIADGLPILKRTHRETYLRGRLRLEDPLQVLPSFVRVRLVQGGKTVLETNAERGAFVLHGEIANGDYRLEAGANCFAGSGKLRVRSYEEDGIELPLERTRCER